MPENDEPTGKKLHVVGGTPQQKKQPAGIDHKQPSNDDYDYRADLGETGGGVQHNPMSDTQTMSAIRNKPKPKAKRRK